MKTLRSHAKVRGERRDEVVYGLMREEWGEQQQNYGASNHKNPQGLAAGKMCSTDHQRIAQAYPLWRRRRSALLPRGRTTGVDASKDSS